MAPDDAARNPEGEPARRRADAGSDLELGIALTPRQILGGFALLAALVLLLRRRGRDRADRG
ncbi:MAG TPA: hypothetical protein VKR30_10670 [Candidatus Limnocylindrales bacterium]|nr:hypothetical protein [Candidatus Limnocylindrales bacterium]